MESRFVAIDKAEITGAELRGKTMQITVRFVSQLVSVTRDKTGDVIDGNADKVTDITDVWTFARDVSARATRTGSWLPPKPGNDGMGSSARSIAAIVFGLGLTAASSAQAVEIRRAQVEPLTFADLDGWQDDDLAAAFATFQKSCGAILEGSKVDAQGAAGLRRTL